MSANILRGPKENSGIPHESLGKLFRDGLNSHKKTSKAVLDIKSGEFYTYGQLLELSTNLASHLQHFGIKKNDVIAIISENSHKFCVALLAGFYLATPVHLINPKYTEYELKHVLNLSKAKLVFCSISSLKNLIEAKKNLDFIKTTILFDDDGDGKNSYFYKDLIESTTSFNIEENVDIEDQVAVICNSSGTTGLPKGVMMTHASSRFHLVYGRDPEIYHMTPNETIPLVVPTVHIYGLHALVGALYSGCTVVMFDHFDPDSFLQIIQNDKVVKLFLVPTLINFLVRSPSDGRYDLSSVKHIYSSGSSVSDDDYQLFLVKFGQTRLHQLYGLTETSGLVASMPKNTPNPKGTCEKLVPGRELKIVDVETQRKLGANEKGEVCVKGHIMKGYINNIKRTKEAIDSDGFLRTGDIGYYNEEGFVFIIGRIKEMIKYKAFQVSPVELENILLKHPSIEDVAIVGKPDARFGEVPVGFVVKKEGTNLTEKEVSDYLSRFVCVEKQLHGGVRFVQVIPRNSLGKILRHKL